MQRGIKALAIKDDITIKIENSWQQRMGRLNQEELRKSHEFRNSVRPQWCVEWDEVEFLRGLENSPLIRQWQLYVGVCWWDCLVCSLFNIFPFFLGEMYTIKHLSSIWYKKLVKSNRDDLLVFDQISRGDLWPDPRGRSANSPTNALTLSPLTTPCLSLNSLFLNVQI